EAADAVPKGVDHFVEHWRLWVSPNSPRIRPLARVRDVAMAARQSAAELNGICAGVRANPPRTREEYAVRLNIWRAAWGKYKASVAKVEKCVPEVQAVGWTSGQSLAELYARELKKARDDGAAAYDRL